MKDDNKPEVDQAESAGVADFPDHEELTVTSIEMLRKPRHRYRIVFGMYSMTVHEDVMLKYRMLKGNVFRKEELLEIVIADERQRAYVDSLYHLSRKPRTSQEIRQRLQQKGYEQGCIETTIERLQQERLIDDALYAKMWAEQRITNHKKGRLWVKQELRQKGIDSANIAEALGEVSADAELQSAMAIGRKKWQQTSGDVQDRRRKTGAFLMRRGFSGEQVRQTLKTLMEEDEAHDDEDDELYPFE
ncbi:RecX family transcriptional regulator [Paenibacillus sp. JCM 10914]|uniref:regulatory protein RecX n=1 Tax=Paenibacillus sp. JCM 10914 TaxID=1236974 RepID=UPI0003CCB60E|nr:RecX family transcriptional regulator [Paenibacillus sp. JCM 10914]GAE04862.1 regulatory protein RecX [Paenibacillus sp. JCM 10914]